MLAPPRKDEIFMKPNDEPCITLNEIIDDRLCTTLSNESTRSNMCQDTRLTIERLRPTTAENYDELLPFAICDSQKLLSRKL
jgi:hypothetical protein